MKNKIEILSKKQAEQRIATGYLSYTAVISFYDPKLNGYGDEPICYDSFCDRVFYVTVHDIDMESLPEFGLTFDTYFPEAHSLAIFIKHAIIDGYNIICQCEYGESRSAACAAAIYEYYEKSGIQIFASYQYCPNQLIFNKLLVALQDSGEDVVVK